MNFRAYAEESQALLRKQQINIDKLRKENDSIKVKNIYISVCIYLYIHMKI